MNALLDPSKFAKRIVRTAVNQILAHRGLEITPRCLERSPMRQLMLALQHFSITTVLDVGANTGQFAQELLKTGYAGDIWSVEPLPDVHKVLCANAEPYLTWRVMDPVALGSEEGDIEITVAGNSFSSSALEMLDRHIAAAPDSAPVRKVVVKQVTIDRLFSDVLNAADLTLLKIDTQGYEHAILQGAAEALRKVELVLLELSLQPLYRGQVLWLDLIAYMRQQGFEIWSIQPEFCDPTTGQMLQVNGLFSRQLASRCSPSSQI